MRPAETNLQNLRTKNKKKKKSKSRACTKKPYLLNGDVVDGPGIEGTNAELDQHCCRHRHPAIEWEDPQQLLLALNLRLRPPKLDIRVVPSDVVDDGRHGGDLKSSVEKRPDHEIGDMCLLPAVDSPIAVCYKVPAPIETHKHSAQTQPRSSRKKKKSSKTRRAQGGSSARMGGKGA